MSIFRYELKFFFCLFPSELPGVYDNKTTCVVVSLLQLFLLSAALSGEGD